MTTQQPTKSSAQRIAKISLPLMAAIIIVDQLTKWLVVENLEPDTAYPIIGDWFRLYLVRNPGAAFSFGTDITPILALLQLTAFIVCIVVSFRLLRNRHGKFVALPIGLIGGGAAGNFIDRLFREPGGLHGHVVDFFSFWDFAIFNIADSAITVGVVCYLVYAFIIEPRNEAKNNTDTDHRSEEEIQ